MNKIIQVRGTSGSGKSTIMNAVISGLKLNPYKLRPNLKPLYHYGEGIVVLGTYDGITGGCDNIGANTGYRGGPGIYRLIKDAAKQNPGYTIIGEGVILSEDVIWTTKLKEEGFDVRLCFLSTPIDECIRRIDIRRERKGMTRPYRKQKTIDRHGTIHRSMLRLKEAGVTCHWCNCKVATQLIRKWLAE